MPKFEIRCNTERVLVVEADDEQSAREIAEDTDFSDWDSADSPYSIAAIDSSPDQPVDPVNQSEAAYTLRIDGELFRHQRKLLLNILDAASQNQSYVPAVNDVDLLEGMAATLDEIADQAHDKYGIDCLLENDEENSG
jgi:hypothetical protein